MNRLQKKITKRGVLLCGAILLLLTFLLPCVRVSAQEEPKTVLRVAFPEVEGYTETDENGSRHGVVVDYLNEIAKYTGWKYEYIETDGETMLNEFLDGQFDLMGGTYYMQQFEKYFAYPDYNCGYSKSVLFARRDNNNIKPYDWKSMSGKTIGVYENAKENIRRLEMMLKSNDMDCTLKYYTSDQLVDGNLYSYLENGEVDMLLGNSADYREEFRAVGKFDSQPHYIVTTPGNQEVLDGLNMAMEEIIDSNPDFADERYEANFYNAGIEGIYLNDDEIKYIEKKKSVSVAVVNSWHPLYCMASKTSQHNGLIPDILKKIQEFTGLQFNYVSADNYAEALELVKQGKADILGAFLGTEDESIQMNMVLTASYASMNDIVVRNKSVTFPSKGLTGALIEGREMPTDIAVKEVKYYKSVADALEAVNGGKVDFFYGISSKIEDEIQKHRYANVIPNTVVNNKNNMNLAMANPADTELLTILNKAINNLGNEEKDEILARNLISEGANSPSILEMIYADPVTFATILLCVFAVLMILVLIAASARVRATKMQSSLEKAEASNRAKGEFLSRMSHEIRTPMNAIVGLSDLTCMKEDVPEDIHENLTKIRSSSHYMLSLISDILDMSRIENGMLTINSESFSMEQLTDELKSMMTSDAARRGIDLIVNRENKNDILMGDVIRLKQVLVNLTSNALKFTPEGGEVRISITELEFQNDKARFCFRVTDNGIGIAKENQESVFGVFEQVGSNYSKSQGTGLGLAISKIIVEMMGGELKLKSELGKGSEFYFTVDFPVGKMGKKEEHLSEEYYLGPIRILLAEDNDLNAEIATALLEMQGASVCRAENGKKAVEMFQDSAPGEFQVILMDIQMPEMGGLDACRAIRKIKREDAAEIPIIAMTANSFKEDMDAAMEAGMNDFIAKPIEVKCLYGALHKAVNQGTVK